MTDNKENYIPESYMTVEMVKEVMNEFTWPLPYDVIEGYDEDYAIIKFPTCEIELYDVPEDGISMTFLTYDNGKELNAAYVDIVYLECIENYNPEEHLDIEYNEYEDRERDTQKMIRNKMKNLQYYHLGFITGTDYSWVEKYLKRKKSI